MRGGASSYLALKPLTVSKPLSKLAGSPGSPAARPETCTGVVVSMPTGRRAWDIQVGHSSGTLRRAGRVEAAAELIQACLVAAHPVAGPVDGDDAGVVEEAVEDPAFVWARA